MLPLFLREERDASCTASLHRLAAPPRCPGTYCTRCQSAGCTSPTRCSLLRAGSTTKNCVMLCILNTDFRGKLAEARAADSACYLCFCVRSATPARLRTPRCTASLPRYVLCALSIRRCSTGCISPTRCPLLRANIAMGLRASFVSGGEDSCGFPLGLVATSSTQPRFQM